MEAIVKQIIGRIESGVAFDSHFVIDTLIKEHSDDYLRFAAENLALSGVTKYVHSEISKIILSLEGEAVEKLPYDSLSYNIHGDASRCALWRKL